MITIDEKISKIQFIFVLLNFKKSVKTDKFKKSKWQTIQSVSRNHK